MRPSSIPTFRLFALLVFCGACRGQTDAALRAPSVLACGASPASLELYELPRGTPELSAVITHVRPTVVSVIAGRAAQGGHPFSSHAAAREHALGSGFVIASDGLVLTSRHVIDGADDLRVELDDGRSFAGTVVARDAVLDVALIRLTGARGLPVVELGSSDALRVGDAVIAIGNPFGLGPSVTRGVLSAEPRAVEDGPSGVYLQSDAAVNPGDSGGPLLDGAGRVIGINTAIIEHGQGISFAVPIDDVRAVLHELETTGRVSRGHAGLTFQALDAPLARALGLPGPGGAIVTETDGGGPAQHAGVRPGDVITAMEGRAIRNAGDLAHQLERRKPGDVVRFRILRGGGPRTIAVLLERLPNRDGDAEKRATATAARSRGATGLRLVDADGGGARVEGLDPESTAADDLRAGDVVVEVNGTAVKCAADVTRRLSQLPRPSTALLRVRRDGSFVYIGVDLA